jgi:2'-5' RNA ligase
VENSGAPSARSLQSSVDLHFASLNDLLAPWRTPTVEVASLGVPPHITLLWPWVSAPVQDHELERLRKVVTLSTTFDVTFDRVGTFPNGTIFLGLEDARPTVTLMRAVQDEFPDCLPYDGEFADVEPVPHVTICKPWNSDSPRDFAGEIRAELAGHLPICLRVREAVVMEECSDGHWHSVASVSLARPSTS